MALEMVDRLSLNIDRMLYKLAWSRKGNEEFINQPCPIIFSFSQYCQDLQWCCDMVLMEASLLLLSSMWPNVLKVVNDGFKITNTLWINGVTVILDLSRVENIPKPFKEGGNNF